MVSPAQMLPRQLLIPSCYEFDSDGFRVVTLELGSPRAGGYSGIDMQSDCAACLAKLIESPNDHRFISAMARV